MNIDTYVAIVDTCILMLLCAWSLADRCNWYFRDKDK